MIKINLFDQNFRHTFEYYGFDSSSLTKPNSMCWIRDQLQWDGVTVFTDGMCNPNLVQSVKSKVKVAWLMEPPGIGGSYGDVFQKIKYFHEIFDLVLSYHDYQVLGVPKEKWHWIPFGGAWVEPQQDTRKEKLCSIIASEKNFMTGHKLRHEIAQQNKDKIDLLGGAYKRLENKKEGHANYAFSVVIENEKHHRYFTEKLIDCFLCKSVPIYWGADKIDDIFDMNGVIQIQDANEAKAVIENLSFQKFDDMKDCVEKNFNTAKKFMSTDDIIAKLLNERFST